MRGSIRIEKNPVLCYVDTIDWAYISHAGEEHFIKVCVKCNVFDSSVLLGHVIVYSLKLIFLLNIYICFRVTRQKMNVHGNVPRNAMSSQNRCCTQDHQARNQHHVGLIHIVRKVSIVVIGKLKFNHVCQC